MDAVLDDQDAKDETVNLEGVLSEKILVPFSV